MRCRFACYICFIIYIFRYIYSLHHIRAYHYMTLYYLYGQKLFKNFIRARYWYFYVKRDCKRVLLLWMGNWRGMPDNNLFIFVVLEFSGFSLSFHFPRSKLCVSRFHCVTLACLRQTKNMNLFMALTDVWMLLAFCQKTPWKIGPQIGRLLSDASGQLENVIESVIPSFFLRNAKNFNNIQLVKRKLLKQSTIWRHEGYSYRVRPSSV